MSGRSGIKHLLKACTTAVYPFQKTTDWVPLRPVIPAACRLRQKAHSWDVWLHCKTSFRIRKTKQVSLQTDRQTHTLHLYFIFLMFYLLSEYLVCAYSVSIPPTLCRPPNLSLPAPCCLLIIVINSKPWALGMCMGSLAVATSLEEKVSLPLSDIINC